MLLKPFKGYLLEMRRVDDDEIIAGFSIHSNGQRLTCDNQVYSFSLILYL